MQRKAMHEEAAKLIAQFGKDAYAKAMKAEREARRKRNTRLANFYGSMARQIAKESK